MGIINGLSDFKVIELLPRTILLLCWITLMFIRPVLLRRNEEGAYIYGSILGFIHYLKKLGSKFNDIQLIENNGDLIPYFFIFNINCRHAKVQLPKNSVSQNSIMFHEKIPAMAIHEVPKLKLRDYNTFFKISYRKTVYLITAPDN
jgi:hypothetical protein